MRGADGLRATHEPKRGRCSDARFQSYELLLCNERKGEVGGRCLSGQVIQSLLSQAIIQAYVKESRGRAHITCT